MKKRKKKLLTIKLNCISDLILNLLTYLIVIYSFMHLMDCSFGIHSCFKKKEIKI